MKNVMRIGLICSICIAMMACQSLKTQPVRSGASEVSLSCEGTPCHFLRANDVQIYDAQQPKVFEEALRLGIVKQTGHWWQKNREMFLNLPSGSHEVVVKVYPISPLKAEAFHLIHRFDAHQRYRLVFYRQSRDTQKAKSLLESSAPMPLCVDLRQDEKTLRSFCRRADVVTGFGEFKEVSRSF